VEARLKAVEIFKKSHTLRLHRNSSYIHSISSDRVNYKILDLFLDSLDIFVARLNKCRVVFFVCIS